MKFQYYVKLYGNGDTFLSFQNKLQGKSNKKEHSAHFEVGIFIFI